MFNKTVRLQFTFLIFLSLMACTFPLTADTLLPEQTLETVVAATLTAFPYSSPTVAPQASTQQPIPTHSPSTQPTTLRVAYIKGGNVYTWSETGGVVGLSETNDAVDLRISDDGQIIAFLRESPDDYFHQELWAVNTQGTATSWSVVSAADFDALKPTSPNPSAPGLVVRQFEFRPGTHILAYNTAPRFEGPGSLAYEDLRLYNLDDGTKAILFDFMQGGIFYYSPDGAQIALVKPTSISLVNVDGNNLRANLVTFPQVTTYSEYQYYPKPHWASDSGSLRVTIPPAKAMDEPLSPSTLWYIPTDGSPGMQVGSVLAMPFDWPDNAFSPDLARLVYVKQTGTPEANLRELHIANADGSNDVVFYQGEAVSFLHWLPDSAQFAFRQFGAGEMYGTHIAHVNGNINLLTNTPENLRDLRWITADRFLAAWQTDGGVELRLHTFGPGANSIVIDTFSDSPAFDFTQ